MFFFCNSVKCNYFNILLFLFVLPAGLISCSLLSKKSSHKAVSINGEAGRRDPASVNRSFGPDNSKARKQVVSLSVEDLKKHPISHVVLGVKGQPVCSASTVNKSHLVPSFARTAQTGRATRIDLPKCNEQQMSLIEGKAQTARLYGDKIQTASAVLGAQGVIHAIRYGITFCALGSGMGAIAHDMVRMKEGKSISVPAMGTVAVATGVSARMIIKKINFVLILVLFLA